jgi:hypothetical protein
MPEPIPTPTPIPSPAPTPTPTPVPTPISPSFVSADGTLSEGWQKHEKIDADIRTDKTLGGIKSVPEMARQLVNAEKLIGKKRLVLPEGEQDVPAMDALARAVGWPESPDKYPAIVPPAGVTVNPEMDKMLRQWSHALRFTPGQFAGLAQRIAELNVSQVANETAAAAKVQETAVNAQKTAWGDRYGYNIQLANTAAAAFAGQERLLRLQQKGYLADPDFLAFCKEVGEAVSPDRLHVSAGGTPDKGGIQRQISELETSDAYRKSAHPRHSAVTAQVLQLREQLLMAR